MTKRSELVSKIEKQGWPPSPNAPLPVVTVEEFFEGNDDYGSIACNINDHPGPAFFYALLKSLRLRPDVQDIVVEISDIADDKSWPFSERIYILTSSGAEEIRSWLDQLQPDEIEHGFAFGTPSSAPKAKDGYAIYAAWWD